MDEIQNYTLEEGLSTLTRVGLETRVIVCGDGKQNDLHYKKTDVSGFCSLLAVTKRMGSQHFTHVEFNRDDIVRSDFVKAVIIACEDLNIEVGSMPEAARKDQIDDVQSPDGTGPCCGEPSIQKTDEGSDNVLINGYGVCGGGDKCSLTLLMKMEAVASFMHQN